MSHYKVYSENNDVERPRFAFFNLRFMATVSPADFVTRHGENACQPKNHLVVETAAVYPGPLIE